MRATSYFRLIEHLYKEFHLGELHFPQLVFKSQFQPRAILNILYPNSVENSSAFQLYRVQETLVLYTQYYVHVSNQERKQQSNDMKSTFQTIFFVRRRRQFRKFLYILILTIIGSSEKNIDLRIVRYFPRYSNNALITRTCSIFLCESLKEKEIVTTLTTCSIFLHLNNRKTRGSDLKRTYFLQKAVTRLTVSFSAFQYL